MKPAIATVIGLVLAACAGQALAQSSFGKPSKGTIDLPPQKRYEAPKTWGASPPALGAPPSHRPQYAPFAPIAPIAEPPQQQPFKPYQPYEGDSVYSDRGGLDSYPGPPTRRKRPY